MHRKTFNQITNLDFLLKKFKLEKDHFKSFCKFSLVDEQKEGTNQYFFTLENIDYIYSLGNESFIDLVALNKIKKSGLIDYLKQNNIQFISV